MYGDASKEKISEIHDAVRIDVRQGDVIKLSITSPEDARLQAVNIKLQVAYLEPHQRMSSPDLSNNTNATGQ